MWNINDASKLVKEIHDKIEELGYHVLLGGSVLYDGSSDNDLDLYFSPLNGYDSNISAIFDFLNERFGPLHSLRDAPDYDGSPVHWTLQVWNRKEENRIDFFIN